jgi:hypothetical protein
MPMGDSVTCESDFLLPGIGTPHVPEQQPFKVGPRWTVRSKRPWLRFKLSNITTDFVKVLLSKYKPKPQN